MHSPVLRIHAKNGRYENAEKMPIIQGLTIKFENSPPCSPWEQWTEISVRFDDVGVSTFNSCAVVDLWQSLSEWRILLTELCFGVLLHDNSPAPTALCEGVFS
jgi:hypothetical protein